MEATKKKQNTGVNLATTSATSFLMLCKPDGDFKQHGPSTKLTLIIHGKLLN